MGLDDKMEICKITTPLTNCADDAQQLPFVSTVTTFDRVHFSAVITDGRQALARVLLQNSPN